MAAKAVAFAEARQPRSRPTPSRWPTTHQAFADGLMRRGAKALVTDGTDNHIVLLDVQSFRADRPTGRRAPCWTPASSPTATPYPPTPTAPGTPVASGSARRR